MNKKIDEAMLSKLRMRVIGSMSVKRATHTVAVEAMAVRLGKIYAPDKILQLRAAALLHDVTKEKKLNEQLELCERYGVEVNECDCFSPKTFHAKTAAASLHPF